MAEPKKDAEFIVDGFVQGEVFSVVGRCGDFPIHRGEVFDAVIRYKPYRTLEDLANPPVLEIEKSASIRVLGISAYGRSLEALGEGMTGSLQLEGDGLQYLGPGWTLGHRREHTNGVVHAATPSHFVANS